MARETYVMRGGELVPKRFAAPLNTPSAAPNVISDHLDGVVNPVDGRPYDSKSAYYRAVRNAGCEIAGNDPSIRTARDNFTPSVTARDIAETWNRLRGN